MGFFSRVYLYIIWYLNADKSMNDVGSCELSISFIASVVLTYLFMINWYNVNRFVTLSLILEWKKHIAQIKTVYAFNSKHMYKPIVEDQQIL